MPKGEYCSGKSDCNCDDCLKERRKFRQSEERREEREREARIKDARKCPESEMNCGETRALQGCCPYHRCPLKER
jgi:hypothetical protein